MDLERRSPGFGHRPALIIVDMIRGFTDPACPLGVDCPEVVDANRHLIKRFRARNLPVIYTTVVYRDAHAASVFRDRVPALNFLTPDSKWIEVDPRLHRRESEPLVEKFWASGFFETPLKAMLDAENVDGLVVTGLTTSGCVRATAVDGLQHNYPVLVVREAVGDRNPDAHAANLHDLHAKYADVVSLDDILMRLDA